MKIVEDQQFEIRKYFLKSRRQTREGQTDLQIGVRHRRNQIRLKWNQHVVSSKMTYDSNSMKFTDLSQIMN